MAKKKPSVPDGTIALNKKAKHEYFLEESFEAGVVLEGWEVKSLREGRAQLVESYIDFKNGEAWLLGAHFSPLKTACTHVVADPVRPRKLLLNRTELNRLAGAVEAKGFTCVALSLYWKESNIKCEIGLAKGKKLHDKRATEKERDWNREKQRVLSKNQ